MWSLDFPHEYNDQNKFEPIDLFDAPTQHQVWNGFERVLAPSGYLLIGHSERVNGPAAARFSTAGLTTYRKNA